MSETYGASRSTLEHVRWICGSASSGKTTVSKILAERFALSLYHCDLYYEKHFDRAEKSRHPQLFEFGTRLRGGKTWGDLNLDPPHVFRSKVLRFGREDFDMVIEDVDALPKNHGIIVEGAFLLPEQVCTVAPLENAVCLVAVDSFMMATREKQQENPDADETHRDFVSAGTHPQEGRIRRNSDEVLLWMAKFILENARRVNMKVILVDGSSSTDEISELVVSHFRLRTT